MSDISCVIFKVEGTDDEIEFMPYNDYDLQLQVPLVGDDVVIQYASLVDPDEDKTDFIERHLKVTSRVFQYEQTFDRMNNRKGTNCIVTCNAIQVGDTVTIRNLDE